MAKMGSADFSELKKLQENLNKMVGSEDATTAFCEACAKELAARLLRAVIKRTPVGDYTKEITVTAKRDGKKHKKGEQYTKKVNPSGKKGGTLRKGWTANKGIGSEGLKTHGASEFVDTLKVHHFGNAYVIEITNSVEYASYVEYGHRKSNHKGWVPGHLMMTISENEIRRIAPQLLEKKLTEFLKGAFDA
mgnify:CR=1 FL=1